MGDQVHRGQESERSLQAQLDKDREELKRVQARYLSARIRYGKSGTDVGLAFASATGSPVLTKAWPTHLLREVRY
eukprot:3803679-Rhodomonas_salina.5